MNTRFKHTVKTHDGMTGGRMFIIGRDRNVCDNNVWFNCHNTEGTVGEKSW